MINTEGTSQIDLKPEICTRAVSGRVFGSTDTLSLAVESLYESYEIQAAFAVASLLAMLALVTLVLKVALEWWHRDELHAVRLKKAT